MERGRNTFDFNEPEPAPAGLQTRDIVLLVSLNALVSAIISVVVVILLGPWAVTNTFESQAVADTVSALPVGQAAADATFTATPTITPTPEPQLYTVASGDSLSQIAFRFNVSVQDILVANGFDNPDFIRVGQTLLIPAERGDRSTLATAEARLNVPTETPLSFDPPTPDTGAAAEDITLTATPMPTAIPTATAPPLDQIVVRITNIYGYGELSTEQVTILNEGPGVTLAGWTLRGATAEVYNFPNVFLWSGGSVRVHTATGANTPSDLYWGQSEARWFSGDTVELLDADGKVISGYVIP